MDDGGIGPIQIVALDQDVRLQEMHGVIAPVQAEGLLHRPQRPGVIPLFGLIAGIARMAFGVFGGERDQGFMEFPRSVVIKAARLDCFN